MSAHGQTAVAKALVPHSHPTFCARKLVHTAYVRSSRACLPSVVTHGVMRASPVGQRTPGRICLTSLHASRSSGPAAL